MTQEQFDNYQFSINTEVLHRGEWVGITEVDFKERWLGLKNGYYVKYNDEITDLRN